MAFVPLEFGVKVALQYLFLGQEVVNTLWFITSDERHPIYDDVADLALLVATQWSTSDLRTAQSDQLILQSVYAKSMESQFAPSVTDTTFAGNAGGSASVPYAEQNAFCVTFRTERAGRSGRGRNYLGGLTEGNVIDGVVNSTYADAAVEFYEDLAVSVFASQWYHCVASKQQLGVVSTEYTPFIVRSYGYWRLHTSTQRKRVP